MRNDNSASGRARFGPCYAASTEREFTIGNALVERRWRVENGLLYATSLRDRATGREWLARPSGEPAPCPPIPPPSEPRAVAFAARSGALSPVEEPSLVVELTARGATLTLAYRFQIFPTAGGVISRLGVARTAGADEPAAARAAPPTGVEEGAATGRAGALPALDSVERFALAPQHLRLIQVIFQDQTDVHNELAAEREWLLHPNEAALALEGNLFVIEDTLTRAGLIFVKHAPLPHARPAPTGPDLRVNGRGAAWRPRPDGAAFGPAHPAYPLAYECALYGHGAIVEGGDGYQSALLAYTGRPAGRIAALQTYQRQLRRYDPARDGLFLSNTWGDRSQDGRITDAFLREEITAAARLGVDVVQIDDGWQRGRTANSVRAGGVWEGFWASDPDFWAPHPARLPHGLAPLAELARAGGMRLGLWFAPDSTADFANWERDAAAVLALHRAHGINHFKIDGVKVRTPLGERNLRRFCERTLRDSDGRVVLDLDVTAEVRPAYWGLMQTGPIYVENRYTDWHGYWPHQTLRNLWKLAGYVDPLRLRMEFLNTARNADLYAGDPLAPAGYSPAYLFATTMVANPLGWFEVSNLPRSYFDEVAPLVAVWKAHRERLQRGRILPVGEAPDGTAWTGFLAVAEDGRDGYLLAFRERNDRERWSLDLPLFTGPVTPRILWGDGAASVAAGRLTVTLPRAQDFLFVRLAARRQRARSTPRFRLIRPPSREGGG